MTDAERFEALKAEIAASSDQSWRETLPVRWAQWRLRGASQHFSTLADLCDPDASRALIVNNIHAIIPSIMNAASLLIGGVVLSDPVTAEATLRMSSAPKVIEDKNIDSEA